MELIISPADTAQLASIVFYYAQRTGKVKLVNQEIATPTLKIPDQNPVEGEGAIALYLCQTLNLPIYPEAHRAEIDKIVNDYPNYNAGELNNYFAFRSYAVGSEFTVADIAIYSALSSIIVPGIFRLHRWANLVSQQAMVKRFAGSHAKKAEAGPAGAGGKAVKKKVCTRFAPEPSGYLHIGHAKAALASEDFARRHNGTFVLRFDDTNPKLESRDFEEKILEDVKLLDVAPDRRERTSDQIPMILDIIKQMIKDDLAFVDDTPNEQIKEQRINLRPSPNRDNPPAKSLELFEEMMKGTEKGFQCVARAKIDYKSSNGCMRDPVIARCIKNEHAEPNACPVYPTYDVCCPIIDSKNGITHAMRSWEYTDRDHQYRWFIEKLKLTPVEIVSFSRLSFNYTVLGKRYLRRLVENKKASGWDDPRFPTIRGLRRRGLQPSALRKFCQEQGASRNQNLHDWDKLWAMNRQEILPTCDRVMSVSDEEKVVFNVAGAPEGDGSSPVLPGKPEKGARTLHTGPTVWVPEDDAIRCNVGDKVTLMGWTNVIIDNIVKEGDKIKQIDSHWVDDKDYKKTVKFNWIHPEKNTKIVMREWNHLLKVKMLGEDQDVLDAVFDEPYADTLIYCDNSIANAKKGTLYQLERRAEVIIDEEAADGKPAIAFLIPTGFQKKKVGLPIKISLATDAE
ncbi:putative glutamate--tRNA ligase, cytoplasmic [Tritrichomonas foetus]|uniref:Glutamate--tRNA ligase, cytoplasmic n=1 Tax=Tritrichomonas foetus TaxID=1144522 RepID=A0A1J4K247_9EUKA|nr:putative glutamate--tRNA ligase, cytoplasmic [Tritrichomonas foetus]|eukprot:OHT03812.1 putative glutamate--tRNA ligase, cytoplasmic [Tritrichomonas foetus]